MKQINKLMTIVLVVAASGLFQQCSSDDAPSKPVVLMGGYSPTDGANWGASYVKDGVFTQVDKSGTSESNVYAAYTSGKNVYLAGYHGAHAAYWKNGVMTELELSPGSSYDYASNIVVKDGVVHMTVRSSTGDVLYWKNGVYTSLNCAECYSSWNGNGLVIVNNDVYIGGYKTNAQNTWQAGYWKNGEWHAVYTGNSTSYGYAIDVVGNDVYIAGSYYDNGWVPCYWKNGEVVNLSTDQGWAYDIQVVDNDVYVTGNTSNGEVYHAFLWKNGTVASYGDGTTSYYGYSVEVKNGDVYVSGEKYDTDKGYLSLLWKNGELVAPFDGTQSSDLGYFYALFVK